MENRSKVIAIDFDGTLFENEYPNIGKPIKWIIERAKEEQEKGAKLILWTCRGGKELKEAVDACSKYGLYFDAVNDNLPELIEEWGNNNRKIFAHEYWDDRNCLIDFSADPDSDGFDENGKCTWGEGVSIRPDGIHDLDPCLYEEVQVIQNVTIVVSRCVRCGQMSFGWKMQNNSKVLLNRLEE